MKSTCLVLLFIILCSGLNAQTIEQTHNEKALLANSIKCEFIIDAEKYANALSGWKKQNAPQMVDMGFLQGLRFRGLKDGVDGYVELLKYTMKPYADPQNANKENDYYLGSEKVNYGPYPKNTKVYVTPDASGSAQKLLIQIDKGTLREYYMDEFKMMVFQEYTK